MSNEVRKETFAEKKERIRQEGLRKIFAQKFAGPDPHSIYDVYGIHDKGLTEQQKVETLEEILNDIQNDGEYRCFMIYESEISDIHESRKNHEMNCLRSNSDVYFRIEKRSSLRFDDNDDEEKDMEVDNG